MPEGFLLVYSVDTEEEAQSLVVGACKMGLDGECYAPELMHEQTLENLYAFSAKIHRVHQRLQQNGACKCKPTTRGEEKWTETA